MGYVRSFLNGLSPLPKFLTMLGLEILWLRSAVVSATLAHQVALLGIILYGYKIFIFNILELYFIFFQLLVIFMKRNPGENFSHKFYSNWNIFQKYS